MKARIIITLIFLFPFIFCHKCGLDLKPNKEPTFVDHYRDSFRFLQDTSWTSIRIYVDYTQLDSQLKSKMITSSYYDSIKSLTNKTISLYQTLLNVKRSPNKLKLNVKCVDNVDPKIFTEGIDTDLIIFPSVSEDDGGDVEASAGYCAQDGITYRPLAGTIEFASNLNFTQKNSDNYIIMLILHELNHILCFHDQLFPYFIDFNGKKIPLAETITSEVINGKTRTLLKSPKVLEKARKHFGCNTLNGIELEDQGGSGTAGSHWEARSMLADYMIGISYGEVFISEMSLALFEDSGWYTVNYYTGGLFRYGKNQGCNFLKTKCIQDGSTQFPNEFNVKENPATMCLAGRTGKGYSSLNVLKEPIEPEYNYWDNVYKGGFHATDYCPVAWPNDADGYFFGSSCAIGKAANTIYGEIIGIDSSCFISSLTKKGNKLNYEKATCFKVTCDYTKKKYTVRIAIDAGYSVECPTEGGKMSVSGLDGEFLCPDFNLICTQTTVCYDAIDCINKKVVGEESSYTYNYIPIGNYQKLSSITTITNSGSNANGINTTNNSSINTANQNTSNNSNISNSNGSNSYTNPRYLYYNFILMIIILFKLI
jgi:hypothetical protein